MLIIRIFMRFVQFFRGKSLFVLFHTFFCMSVYTAEVKNPKKRERCINLQGFVLSGDSSAEVREVHVS